MASNESVDSASAMHPKRGGILERLDAALNHASHLLPAQGPISVFIHHNTLHAFEQLPFPDALQKASATFGCETYLSEERFHTERAKRRILDSDLRAVVFGELGESATSPIAPGVTRADLHLAMLINPLWVGTPAELRWQVGENGIPPREVALWRRCLRVVRELPAADAARSPLRLRTALVNAGGADPDLPVNELLTRYTAAFLDQGVSRVSLPQKAKGYFRSFCGLYSLGGGVERWYRKLAPLCRAALQADIDPLKSILESLDDCGIAEADWDAFLSETVLSLRGWGGMICQVEKRADSVHHPIPEGTFLEFLAARLLMDRAAAAFFAQENFDYTGSLAALSAWLVGMRVKAEPSELGLRVFEVYQAARLAAIPADAVTASVAREILAFDSLRRRWFFQLAYERRFRICALDALAYRVVHPAEAPKSPRFQIVTCLDEREESIRRHLVEIAPDCETFGTAGFFAVPMYYRGATDAHFVPLCPIVVTPKHWVTECVEAQATEEYRRVASRRAHLGRLSHRSHLATRTPIIGALISAGAGALASLPLVARILFPRLTGQLRGRAVKVVQPVPDTTLALERSEEQPGDHNGFLGFSLEEMAGMGERFLRDIGLIDGFAKLVLVLGHGSDSLNNPHKSAYDCGACGGSPGAPNGRAIAHLLNDPRVRSNLVERGIRIPDGTRFVGGVHNTCDDSVSLFDTGGVPLELRPELERIRLELLQTCDRNAHERSRRFESCSLDASPAEAHRHVEGRSEDLAQARPELGHATNAICIVGRGRLSRGLFFDRRAFLTSYDPTQDGPGAPILARTLAAVFPVCGGISLEYFFSHVDPRGYGCGTKLPHNITGLLGVMDGAASDLRTGLPWQMTEIHEPIRLLIVIETTSEILEQLLRDNPANEAIVRNGWVQVALMHPDTGAISVFEDGEYKSYTPTSLALRRVHSSVEWYGGKRDHLEFVEIAFAETAGGNRA